MYKRQLFTHPFASVRPITRYTHSPPPLAAANIGTFLFLVSFSPQRNKLAPFFVHRVLPRFPTNCVRREIRAPIDATTRTHSSESNQALKTDWPRNSPVFCREFGWVRFIVVCFLYKINPSSRKKKNCCGKSGPSATFNLVFLGVGLALGWGVRRFHSNIYMFSNPT